MTSRPGPCPQSSGRDSTRTLGFFIPSKRHYTETDLCGGETSRTGVVKYSPLNRNGSQSRCRKSSPTTLVLGGAKDLIRDLSTLTRHEHSPRSLVNSLTRHNDAGAASGGLRLVVKEPALTPWPIGDVSFAESGPPRSKGLA
jgi:hypothetical protein